MEKVPCDLYHKNETEKIFEKVYADLESKHIRYEEIKKGEKANDLIQFLPERKREEKEEKI